MNSDAKMKLEEISQKIKLKIDSIKNDIKYFKKNEYESPIKELENELKYFNGLIKGSDIEKAIKVLTSGNQQRIQEYLSKEFINLPQRTQKFIYHHTTDLAIGGISVYENIFISIDGLLSQGNPVVSIWDMFKDLPEEIDDATAIKSIENLFQNKFWPKALPDFFPIYTKLKGKEYESNPQHFFEDIANLAKLTYEGNEEMYIQYNCLKRLIDTYFSSQKSKEGEKLYATEKLKQFYSQLEEAVAKSPNLQKCGLLNDVSVYRKFLTGENAYENYLELISHPEIKASFFADKDNAGVNEFLHMVEKLPEREQLLVISQYVADPQYQPLNMSNNLIIDHLKNKIKDKSLLVDFDVTMPIFEKLVFCDKPIATCFTKQTITQNSNKALKESEDEVLGIDRNNITNSEITSDSERIDKFKTTIMDYYKYGLVDAKTYDDVLAIVQKFNKNITLEQLKETVAKNSNFKVLMERISSSSRQTFRIVDQDALYPEDCMSPYSRALYDFEILFPKTRLQAIPSVVVFDKMSLAMKAKFNLKVWNQFSSLPIFNKSINHQRALVEFVAVMGLFENDENVEKRRQFAYKLATTYGEKLTLQEVQNTTLLRRIYKAIYGEERRFPEEFEGKSGVELKDLEDFVLNKYLQPCKIKKFSFRNGVVIPQELQGLFGSEEDISETLLSELKKTTGSFGKKIGNFLSPYAKQGNVYKLKKDVVIPEEIAQFIPAEMSVEDYNEILGIAQLGELQIDSLKAGKTSGIDSEKISKIKQIANFINPIQETMVDGLMPRPDLPQDIKGKIIDVILSVNLNRRLNYETAHIIFDGCKQEFNEEFYDLIVKNWGLILDSKVNQRNIKNAQRSLEKAKRYYMARGNSEPTFLDILTYLDKTPFLFEYGLDEFAQEVKNSGVRTQEAYDFYQALLPKMQGRKLTTIPRHQKTYVYTDEKTGKQYKIMTKILRLDDPATMLVGESKFTNCCQVYQNAGQECMEHASTSQNGGIFAVYLINDEGVPEMMTQSWIWTLESKLCLDNVEATELITGKKGEERRLYQDIATYGIVEASKDLLETSRKGVEDYIAEQTEKIKKSSTLTDEQKNQQLKALDILSQRQTLKIITVGEGCDDLNVAETFSQREKPEFSQGPKKYTGYRDSNLLFDGESKQHIVAKTDDEILPVDENYEDVAFYRDDRQIMLKKGENIPHSLLKQITDIERSAHKEKMVNYTENGKPILDEVYTLAQIYGCDPKDLTILAGEDWYYIYSDNGSEIEIYDFAKTEPRLEDEGTNQQREMSLAFNTILAQSVVVKNGQVESIKGIKADLREDTSYLLYLYQKHHGLIEQAGDDLRYKYEDSAQKQEVSPEQQKEIMKNMRKIRESGNKDIYMHKVSFLATEKTIQKTIDRSLSMLDERSL